MDKAFKLDLQKLGVYVEDPSSFVMDQRKGLIGIRVEISVAKDLVDFPKFNVTVVNKRGVRTTVSDFLLIDTEQGKKLTFLAYQQLPEGTRPPLTDKYIATSFVDLCYFQGNEAVDPNYLPPVMTPVAPNALKEDLGWYLPSRFVDTIIDALGKVNEIFLSGLLDEAILYGVVSNCGKE